MVQDYLLLLSIVPLCDHQLSYIRNRQTLRKKTAEPSYHRRPQFVAGLDKASRLARKSDNRAATKTITAIALVSAIVVGAVGIWVLTMSNATPVPSQEIQKPKEIEETIREVPKSHLVVWG